MTLRQEVEDDVVALLKVRGSVTKKSITKQLATKHNTSTETIKRYLDEMSAAGVIKIKTSRAGNHVIALS